MTFTKIEKPLSRNVKFLNLSSNQNEVSVASTDNKSQLSFASTLPSTMKTIKNKTMINSSTIGDSQKRSVINNQLKLSIDQTLSLQTAKTKM